jgi:DNA repair exonuclease SbcCD nuclease subunit
MKLLHFADLHLDRPFQWARTERRQNRRDALVKIMELAETEEVDAILSAGDLFEQEHFSPDTVAFLRDTFGATSRRIFLAPGNHDWYSERSPYSFGEWPSNVHVFQDDQFQPVTLAEGWTLWGAAHRAVANTGGFFENFRVVGDGFHLALAHASESNWLTAQGENKTGWAPFNADQVQAAGFLHAFLGHFHLPRAAEWHTYPGNPDPLEFGETGERGAVIHEISPHGRITRQLRNVAVTRLHDLSVNVAGHTNSSQVRDSVAAALNGLSGGVRMTLEGEVSHSVELDRAALVALGGELDHFEIRLSGVRHAYDLDRISAEATVEGQFVRDAQESIEDLDRRAQVIFTGLRALEGRDDLDVN